MARKINFRADDGRGAFQDETPYRLRARFSLANALALDPIVPIPPVQGPYLLLIDESKWQGNVDHNLMKSRGVRAVWIKASQGVYADSKFEQHTQGAIDAGLDYGFYHFADPAYATAKRAAEHCAGLVGDLAPLSVWLDCERTGGLGARSLLEYYLDWYKYFTELTGHMVEIYTRMSFFNRYVARSSFWSDKDVGLNAARYHLGLSSPWSDGRYRPEDWTFPLTVFDKWQYSADGNGLGAYFGAESHSIDLNLFYGTEAEFSARYNQETPQTLEERVTYLEMITKQEHPEYWNRDPVEPPVEYVEITITDKHKAQYYRRTDSSCDNGPGKPIMETCDDLEPLKVGSIWKCQTELVISCHDTPNARAKAANGFHVYRIIEDGPYHGRFIRADKACK